MLISQVELTHAKAQAILAVIRQIDLYQGDEIVKEKHPLWMAVVALERLSVFNPRSHVQPYRLDAPAHGQWIRCLFASRPDCLNCPPGMMMHEARNLPSSEKTQHPNPELARHWARVLKQTLQSFLEAQ